MASSKYRCRILVLLFAATTINYMDRSILGVLGPTLQYKVFNWSDIDYANINIAFKVAYAIGMLSMGALIDRLGSRREYSLSIRIWSVFGMLRGGVACFQPGAGIAVQRCCGLFLRLSGGRVDVSVRPGDGASADAQHDTHLNRVKS